MSSVSTTCKRAAIYIHFGMEVQAKPVVLDLSL